jgi:hypothetical protein
VVSGASACVVVLVGVAGCAASNPAAPSTSPGTPPGDAAAVADGPAEGSMAVTDAAGTDTGPSLSPLTLHFVLEPRGSAGERSLVLTSTDGRVREIAGTVAATHRCAVAPPARRRRSRTPGGDEGLSVACGLELEVRFALSGTEGRAGKLWTSGGTLSRAEPSRDVPLPSPGALVTLDPTLPDPAGGCVPSSGDAGAPDVDVRAERKTVQAQDPSQPASVSLVLGLPALGVEWREEGIADEYCHGTRIPVAGRLQIGCASAESQTTVTLSTRDGALWLESHLRDYDLDRTDVYGGVALPCGAKVTLPRVHWPNPRWSPVGNCPPCAYAHDLCTDGCYERYGDAEGNLSDRGAECVNVCDDPYQRCVLRCVAHGGAPRRGK